MKRTESKIMRNNMKKSIKGKESVAALILVILAMALGIFTGCGDRDIGKDEATRIALEDAGFTEADVTRLYVSQDRDDGRSLYEVKFTGENTEYDYEVQASNGDILSCNMEEIKQSESPNSGQSGEPSDNQNGGQTAGSGDVQITQEEAVKLALDRVPGAGEKDIRIELEYDDGYYKYEGDIIYDQKEYEFEIDANTGTFLEWSEERR